MGPRIFIIIYAHVLPTYHRQRKFTYLEAMHFAFKQFCLLLLHTPCSIIRKKVQFAKVALFFAFIEESGPSYLQLKGRSIQKMSLNVDFMLSNFLMMYL